MSEGDGDYTIYPNKNNQKQKQKTTTKKQEKVICFLSLKEKDLGDGTDENMYCHCV